MEEKETMEMNTVPKMFWHGVKTRGPKTIFRQKDFGIWKSISWEELGRAAREIGMGLVSLGYEPGEVASILSNTNREWMCADKCRRWKRRVPVCNSGCSSPSWPSSYY